MSSSPSVFSCAGHKQDSLTKRGGGGEGENLGVRPGDEGVTMSGREVRNGCDLRFFRLHSRVAESQWEEGG